MGSIVYEDGRRISLADLPGLIEGAHKNRGLGYRFLKHIERTKLLIFMIDINGFRLSPEYPHRSPLETLILLNKELELYGKDILSKPALLVVNKMDTDDAEAKWKQLKVLLDDYKSKSNFNSLFTAYVIKHLVLGAIDTIPEHMRPTQPVAFEDIWNISVQQDPEAVSKLSLRIRRLLDVYDDLDRTATPLRQIDEEDRYQKAKNRVQESLTEHRSTIVV